MIFQIFVNDDVVYAQTWEGTYSDKPYRTTFKDVGSNFSALTSLRSKRFRAVWEQKQRNESQRSCQK